jgi:hypothetical protein
MSLAPGPPPPPPAPPRGMILCGWENSDEE